MNGKVNVLIVLGSVYDGNRTSEAINERDESTYSGFNWDLWQKVRDALQDRYDFNVTFTSKTDENYNGFVQSVADGRYDLVVGTFFRTAWRESKIDYITQHSIDSCAILHEKRDGLFHDLQQVLLRTGMLMVSLVLIGSVFGLLLFLIDPQRKKLLRTPNQKSRKFLFRSILTGIATMFGEMGFLSENASLSIAGMLLVILIMIISVVLIMFAQAKMTQTMIEVESKYTKENIRGRTFLGFNGYSVVEKMKTYHINVTEKTNISTEKLVHHYLQNKDKYDGCLLAYTHAYPLSVKIPNMTISEGFGDEPAGWIVSKWRNDLRKDINAVLLSMTKTRELQNICHHNFYFDTPVCELI